MSRLNWVGAGLLALSLIALPWASAAFHAAWLAAWWFCLGIVMGAMSTGWIHRLSGGAWGHAAAPAVAALSRRLPWVLIAAVPWLLAVPSLYAWAGTGAAGQSFHAAQPGFKEAWLTPGFFYARLLVYAACWFALSRLEDGARRPKGFAAAALLAHGFLTSLASVDIVMSLMPRWYSTGFGLVMLVSQGIGGCAMIILWTSDTVLKCVPAAEKGAHKAPIGRDLGNLLLMYVMAWGYLAFMQFLIIWAEDLPNEVAWYVPRMQTAWLSITVALAVFQLALPLLALLFRSVKDNPARLRPLALLALAANALYCVWLVMPSLTPLGDPAQSLLLAVLPLAGMALLFFGRGQVAEEGAAHAA